MPATADGSALGFRVRRVSAKDVVDVWTGLSLYRSLRVEDHLVPLGSR